MTGGSPGKWSLAAVVFALLVATTAPTAVAASESVQSNQAIDDAVAVDAVRGPSGESPVGQREPPNNTTVAHRNPSEVSDDESSSEVEAWLSREMADRLSESVNVSREDRERARELVGNDSEYAELAEQYAEVQGQTEGDLEETSGSFAVAGRLQREFIANVEAYHQLHETYRNARTNNESDRTLRLAHELERQAGAVNRTAVRLNESYTNISTEAENDVQSATRSVGEMRANVTSTQQTVRNQTLVRTALTVRATESVGSFTDPVPLAGQLRTPDGDPVADENVTLRVGNRTIHTTTDEEGRFEVAYRPTLTQVGKQPREVAFRPGNESAYLWANATAEFGVRQATPSVTVSNRTETVRYNETLTVNGTVAADGVGVPDVRVALTVDDVQIATGRTDADGGFGLAGRLPANVSNESGVARVQVVPENATASGFGPRAPGSKVRESRLRFGPNADGDAAADLEPARDVAITPANGTTPVAVETTPTSLSVTNVRTFDETAFVAGQLTTDDGEPVPNESVELRAGGRVVGNATTNATGGYATTVGLPSRLLDGNSTVRVVAAYAPSDGNLAPATADGTAELDATGALVSDRQLRFGAIGLLAVAGLTAFVWRRRSSSEPSSTDEPVTTEDASEAGESVDAGRRSAEALLDSATTDIDEGEFDAAVLAAYGAVRRRVERSNGTTPQTHWEFYADRRDDGLSDEQLHRLERLTETYERAAYADEGVPRDAAQAAVEDATALQEAVKQDGEQSSEDRAGREPTDAEPPESDESSAA